MNVPNFYPELPVVPYHRTTVEMGRVINHIKALFVSREVKIAMYVMFRNESLNGSKGINNNYTGVQADVKRWPEELTTLMCATVLMKENVTLKMRRFVAFNTFEGSIDFLADRVQKRGLFVGGTCTKIVTLKIDSEAAWCDAYYKSWVTGDAKAKAPANLQKNLLSIYSQAEDIFKNC